MMLDSIITNLSKQEIKIIKDALKQAGKNELLKKIQNKQILIQEKVKYMPVRS